MSEWTPPSSATPQDFPAQPRDGVQRMVQEVRKIELEIRDRFNNLLKNAGIRVEPGKLIIEGDLEVPNGAIKNDYLESPIDAASFFETVSGFDPGTTSFATVVTESLTVPADRSRALVVANGAWAVKNTTASTATQIHGRVRIGGTAGPTDDEWSEPLRRDTGNGSYTRTVTGLTPGATVDVEVQVYAGADFTADANNFATVSGVVLWLR